MDRGPGAARQGDVAMKVTTRLLIPAAAAALLAACATTDDRALAGSQGTRLVNDAEYIAVVEHMAKHRGVRVQWVNPPKVEVEDD